MSLAGRWGPVFRNTNLLFTLLEDVRCVVDYTKGGYWRVRLQARRPDRYAYFRESPFSLFTRTLGRRALRLRAMVKVPIAALARRPREKKTDELPGSPEFEYS